LLIGGIVDDDIEPATRVYRTLDSFCAKSRVLDIAGYQQRTVSFGFDGFPGGLCVRLFDREYTIATSAPSRANRTAATRVRSRVAARNERRTTLAFARRPVLGRLELPPGSNLGLDARLQLVLRRKRAMRV
jgi:hypothetical protein